MREKLAYAWAIYCVLVTTLVHVIAWMVLVVLTLGTDKGMETLQDFYAVIADAELGEQEAKL